MDLALLPPILGNVTAFFLFYSACPGLLRDRKQGQLTTDPTPFPFAFVSALIWCVYAAALEDLFIFIPNFVGLAAAAFNTATVLRLCRDDRVAVRIEIILVSGVLLVAAAVLTTMTPLVIRDQRSRLSLLGYLAIAVVLVMFASPVIQTVGAVKSGDVSKLSLPLALSQLANGILWTSYGLAQGNMVIVGPNGAGAVLAFGNVIVKLFLKSSRVTAKSKEIDVIHEVTELIQKGGEVVLHSLPHDSFVHVADAPCPQDADVEADAETILVASRSEGTILRIIPTTGKHIALSTVDGRFLRIRPRPASVAGSVFQPSPLQVVAVPCVEPGKEGEFLPLQALYHSIPCLTGDMLQRYAQQENVSFWNPLHRVFLRVNEVGGMDCSCVWNSLEAAENGGRAVPAGWEWERFSLMPAREDAFSTTGQLRPRAMIIGDSSRP